jgi:hypothetical protein
VFGRWDGVAVIGSFDTARKAHHSRELLLSPGMRVLSGELAEIDAA